MEAIRLHKRIDTEGEIHVTGLPCHRGDEVEMILLIGSEEAAEGRLTPDELRNSGLIGIWKGRPEMAASSAYARQLRENAQRRNQA